MGFLELRHQCGVSHEVPQGFQGASCVGSEEAVPGPSVFPSGEPGVSGDFWGSQEGCQGPSRPSGRNRGLPLSCFGADAKLPSLFHGQVSIVQTKDHGE